MKCFFWQDSACAFLFEITKLKIVQKLLYKFENKNVNKSIECYFKETPLIFANLKTSYHIEKVAVENFSFKLSGFLEKDISIL